MASYLYQRGATFHFRLRVPQDLLDRYPAPLIRRSLKTSNPDDALRLAEALYAQFQASFVTMRGNPTATPSDTLRAAQALADRLPGLIPVRYFEGSPTEAMLAAAGENSKTRLQMTAAEKSETAWAYVVMDKGWTQKQIALASGVSDRTVRTMEKKLAEFTGTGRKPPESWMEARGRSGADPEDMDAKVQAVVKKLEKALGSAGAYKGGAAYLLAQALMEWGPRLSQMIAKEILLEGSDEEDEEEEGDEE